MSNPQSKKFIDAAREIGCEETGEAFERAVGKMVPPKLPEPSPDADKRMRRVPRSHQ
jgi:hypothetical protein